MYDACQYFLTSQGHPSVMHAYEISPAELHTLLSQQHEIELVDVRTLEKHQAYNIGGKHIPFEELVTRSHELARDKLIITYCTSGNRSMRALEYLQSLGFNHIKSLAGGMTAWQATYK